MERHKAYLFRLKQECHRLFDAYWQMNCYSRKGRRTAKAFRNLYYQELAKLLDIPIESCHFSLMDEPLLLKALDILKKGIKL